MGGHDGIAWLLRNLGRVAHIQGDDDRAVGLLEASVAWFRKVRNSLGLAWALHHLGVATLAQGNHTRAAILLHEALFLQQTATSIKTQILESLEGFAQLASAQGRTARAAQLLGAADGLRVASGMLRPPGERVPMNALSPACALSSTKRHLLSDGRRADDVARAASPLHSRKLEPGACNLRAAADIWMLTHPIQPAVIAHRVDASQVGAVGIQQIHAAGPHHGELLAVGREYGHRQIFIELGQPAQPATIDIDRPQVPRQAMSLGGGGGEQSQQPIERRCAAGRRRRVALPVRLRATDRRHDDLFSIGRKARRIEALELFAVDQHLRAAAVGVARPSDSS